MARERKKADAQITEIPVSADGDFVELKRRRLRPKDGELAGMVDFGHIYNRLYIHADISIYQPP